MRVVAVPTACNPFLDVKPSWPRVGNDIAVEKVRNQRGISSFRKVISHQLAVLPDAEHIWYVQDRAAVRFGFRSPGEVGLDALAVDGDVLASWGAPAYELASIIKGKEEMWSFAHLAKTVIEACVDHGFRRNRRGCGGFIVTSPGDLLV